MGRPALVPEDSEDNFAWLCSRSSLLCEKSVRDRNGYDYRVEFPEYRHKGPADTQPPWHTAYVQVKSSVTKEISTRIKLSNALKSVQHANPWFIVFYRHRGGRPTEIYARHIWKEMMEEWLRAVRVADMEGKKRLNQKYVTVTFGPGDLHTDDLLEWMEAEIERVGPPYLAEKTALYKSVGYEDGHGLLKFTLNFDSEEEAVQAFMGLRPGLNATSVTFTPQRFGIPAAKPLFSFDEAKIEIGPAATRACEIRFRGGGEIAPIALRGRIVTSALAPFDPAHRRQILFATDFADVTWFDSQAVQCRLHLDAQQVRDVESIERFARIQRWAQVGNVDVQVWSGNKRLLSGELQFRPGGQVAEWSRTECMMGFVGGLAQRTLPISMQELHDGQKGLAMLYTVATSERMSTTFNFDSRYTAPFSNLTYYAVARFGPHVATVLVERTVLEDVNDGIRRAIRFGPPKVHDGGVVSGDQEDQILQRIEADYLRRIEELSHAGWVMGLGDMQVFVEQLRAEEEGRGDGPSLKVAPPAGVETPWDD